MALPDSSGMDIPAETVALARAACPKGTVPMQIRDALGPIYTDAQFTDLFAWLGRPAESPARLTLISIFQFLDDVSDQQAADAVRTRIDWKYARGLPLADPGFHATVLSDFRARLVAHDHGLQLLTTMLAVCAAQGLLHHQHQRTDSTGVLAAISDLSRLELVGEPLRAALNALAQADPDWMRQTVPTDGYDRYATRFAAARLPTKPDERTERKQTIGIDGAVLLAALWAPDTPAALRTLPAVAILRQVWMQQFVTCDGVLQMRTSADLPPARQRIVSPYDDAAHTGAKRNHYWDGYATHVTETVTPDSPQLITHVATTPAPDDDRDALRQIHADLQAHGWAPAIHLVNARYVDADLLDQCAQDGIALYGPTIADTSWQARAGAGFAVSAFTIQWDAQQAICPCHKTSRSWSERPNRHNDQPEIEIRFATADCRACAARRDCTTAAKAPRTLTVQPKHRQMALQRARERQDTDTFRQTYAKRAGIEGSLSQGIRRCGLRQCRYRGQAKTHLQHVLTAIALNMARIADWFAGKPRATTRQSHFAALAPG